MAEKAWSIKQTNESATRQRTHTLDYRTSVIQMEQPDLKAQSVQRIAASLRVARPTDILTLQRVAGNRAMQRLLKIQVSPLAIQAVPRIQREAKPHKPSSMQAKLTPVPRWNQLPAYARDNLKGRLDQPSFDALANDLRLTVLNLYVKLQPLGFWGFVGRLRLEAGKEGQFNFSCTNTQNLWNTLCWRDDFEVKGQEVSENWEAREKRTLGALHFKHFGDIMQAHIDQVGYYHTGKLLRTAVLALRHLWNYHSYQDVFGIRDLLLQQGWDSLVLKGTRATGR